jgi:hypothetical protein
LKFEDSLVEVDDVPSDDDGDYNVTFFFNWSLPPMRKAPDLIVLSAELAGIGRIDLPIEISSVESMGALDAAVEVRLSVVGKVERSLVDIVFTQDSLCDVLDRVHDVSMYLVNHADAWEAT